MSGLRACSLENENEILNIYRCLLGGIKGYILTLPDALTTAQFPQLRNTCYCAPVLSFSEHPRGTMLHRTSLILLLCVLLGLFAIGGCGDSSVDVDFLKISEKNSAKIIKNENAIQVAIAAMISPKETLSTYQQLLEYLGKAMGRPLQLVQRKTYGEVNALLGSGEVDMAFICSGPYATAKETYGFVPLATPVVREIGRAHV